MATDTTTSTTRAAVSYRVRPEQVIATKGGWLTLQMKDGSTVKARKSQVQILSPEGGMSNRRIGDRRFDCRSYVKTVSPQGNYTMHNGDSVALKLDAKDLDAVYKIAARELGCSESELRARYQHLNVGMQRMNLGNRMRGVLAKAAE